MNHTKYDREAQGLGVESKGNSFAVYSACAVFSMIVMFYVLDAIALAFIEF